MWFVKFFLRLLSKLLLQEEYFTVISRVFVRLRKIKYFEAYYFVILVFLEPLMLFKNKITISNQFT